MSVKWVHFVSFKFFRATKAVLPPYRYANFIVLVDHASYLSIFLGLKSSSKRREIEREPTTSSPFSAEAE
jgi:hypothetical protein